jgi:hypothetical protein
LLSSVIPNCEKTAENISIYVHWPKQNFQLLLQDFIESGFCVKIFGESSNIYLMIILFVGAK